MLVSLGISARSFYPVAHILLLFIVTYYVYILTNQHHTVLYTGMTNSLEQRVYDHKVKRNKGFTYKYNCDKLVYFEEFATPTDAIAREKQLKKYLRAWKEDLINKMNLNGRI